MLQFTEITAVKSSLITGFCINTVQDNQLDCQTTGHVSIEIKPRTFRVSKDPHNSLSTDKATPSPVTAHYDTKCCNAKNQLQIKDFLTTSFTINHLLVLWTPGLHAHKFGHVQTF